MTEFTPSKLPKNAFQEIGSDNFEKFATAENAIFVDKTLFIEAIINSQNVLLITRPRRWGKTLNMSMLHYFFSIPIKDDGSIDEDERLKRHTIFSKMKIGAHSSIMEEYLSQYPTIFIGFKEARGATYEDLEDHVKHLLSKLYASHKYLLQSDKLDDIEKTYFRKVLTKDLNLPELESSLQDLSEMLHRHFGKKVIILIDEYDTTLNDWYANQLAQKEPSQGKDDPYLKKVLSLFRGIFGSALKTNTSLERGIVTGILRVAKASLFSGLNNFGEDSVLDKKYAQYFGFTEDEVGTVLHESHMDKTPDILNGMKSWYNGYNVGGLTIYNPWSIINCLNNFGELKAYWLGTASTALLENALILDKFQEELQILIEGGTVEMIADPKMVFADIRSSPNALYNLLLFSGYLTTDGNIISNEDATYSCDAKIPNREVRGVFTSSLQKWVSRKFNIEIDVYSAFINELLKGNIEIFIQTLKDYLEISTSFFATGPKNAELFYNGFILGLIAAVSPRYYVETEKESGTGWADLILTPKPAAKHKNALILEFKFSKSKEDLSLLAKKALEQIETKNYAAKLKNADVAKVFKVGLAFSGKDVEAAFK